MRYYKFNIGDYHGHTGHLSEMEDLAYRRMLDWCYLHEKPLPEDVDEIARLIRMRTHCDCIANALREFFVRTCDGWTHPRVEQEIASTSDKSEKAKKSAKARWSRKHAGLKGDANALRIECERNATHYPLPTTHNPLPNTPHNPPVHSPNERCEFDRFYSAYPKKVGKDAARKAWKKLKPSPDLVDRIIKDIGRRLELGAWDVNGAKAFIPGPAPYLNQRKWEDEIIPRPEFKKPVDFSEIAREADEL